MQKYVREFESSTFVCAKPFSMLKLESVQPRPASGTFASHEQFQYFPLETRGLEVRSFGEKPNPQWRRGWREGSGNWEVGRRFCGSGVELNSISRFQVSHVPVSNQTLVLSQLFRAQTSNYFQANGALSINTWAIPLFLQFRFF